MDSFDKLLNLIKRDTWKPIGLFVGLLIVLSTSISIHAIINSKEATLLILLIFSVIWILFWIYKNKIPKTNKNKIGILLCIHSDERDVDDRVREDFINSLCDSLISNDTHQLSDVLILPYHIASKYKSFDTAKDLIFKSNSLYLLYGTVRKRKNRHIMDLTARVRHLKLSDDNTRRFSHDISSAWIKRFKLENADEEFELFENASNMVSICSRYIIGLAALASRDLMTSEALLVSVRTEISSNKYSDIKTIDNIRKSIFHKLNGIYFLQIQEYLALWEQTREINNISIASDLLNKVYGIYRRNGEYLTYKAIIEVLLKKDYSSALKHLIKIKKKYRDSLWHLNAGFLEACINNEKNSVSYYETAIKLNDNATSPLSLEKIAQFESFIFWYLSENQNYIFLNYLLGVLNECFKGDYERAINDYQEFINTNKPEKLTWLDRVAQKRIDGINAETIKAVGDK